MSSVSSSGRRFAVALETAGGAPEVGLSSQDKYSHQLHQAPPSPPTDSHTSAIGGEKTPAFRSRCGVAIAMSGPNPFLPSSLNRTSTSTRTATGAAASSETVVVSLSTKTPVTALIWLDDSHLACGLQDGSIMFFVRDSLSVTSTFDDSASRGWVSTPPRCFHRVSIGAGHDGDSRRVVQLRLSKDRSTDSESDFIDNRHDGEAQTLWILYEDRVVVCTSARALIAFAR